MPSDTSVVLKPTKNEHIIIMSEMANTGKSLKHSELITLLWHEIRWMRSTVNESGHLATDAASLNSGMPKYAVWVESMVLPLGNLTFKGFCGLILFPRGTLINRKCPVHPESTIAVS
jgi:hypothetical protein